MSLIGDIVFLASTGLQVALTAFSVLVTLLLGIPLRIFNWTVTFWSGVFNIALQFISKPRLVIALFAVTTVMLTVGPVGVERTGLLMKGFDATAEIVGRPVLEVANKFVLIGYRELYRGFASTYNTIVTYFIARGRVLVMDATDLYNIIATTGDYFRALSVPKILWRWAWSFLGYFWTTEPLPNKREFIDPSVQATGSFFRFPISATTSVNRRAFEYNPQYGAFGTSVIPPNILFYLRNIIVDFVVIVQDVGDLLFCAIEDLGAPGQKFFPNFILDVNAETSYWRRIADLTCRVLSFTFASSLYPRDGTGFQKSRFDLESYLCRILRFIACLLRYVSLLINDITTINRAQTGTLPSKGFQLLLDKLKAVPVIDLFIYYATNPFDSANINIISKNIFICEVGNELQLSPPGNLAVNLAPSVIQATVYSCPGLALNTFVATCPEWNGLAPPQVGERIDYFRELFKCIIELAELVTDATGQISDSSPTSAAFQLRKLYDRNGSPTTEDGGVIKPILSLIFTLVYQVNANIYPSFPVGTLQCCQTCMGELVERSVETLSFSILAYIYAPKTCRTNAYSTLPDQGPDPFSCALALLSQDSGGFFAFLCKAVDGIADFAASFGANNALSQLKCDAKRKRNVASEQFEAPSNIAVTRVDLMKLSAMQMAYDLRRARQVVAECTLADGAPLRKCDAGCAVAGCVKATLDCIGDRLPADNYWSGALAQNSTWTRNLIMSGAYVSDALSGCEDSAVHGWYKSATSLVALARDWSTRFWLVWSDYVPSYFSCMNMAIEMGHNNATAAEINVAYLRCLGLDVSTNSTDESGWTDTLNEAGIAVSSSWCASQMHARGVVLEDTPDVVSLSAEHAWYRLCMASFAVGARATVRGTSKSELADFTNMWRAPLALMQSTDRLDADYLFQSQLRDVFADALPVPFPLLLNAPHGNHSAGEDSNAHGRVNYATQFLSDFHAHFSTAFAYGNYLADVYEQAVIVHNSGEEKDLIAQRLFRHNMGIKEAPASQQSTGLSVAPVESALVQTNEARRARFQKSAAQAGTLIEAFSAFGETLYWAGHMEVHSNNETYACPYEFYLDVNGIEADQWRTPVLGLRALREHDDAMYIYDKGSTSLTTWKAVRIDRLEALLERYAHSTHGTGRGEERQLVRTAVSTFDLLHKSLTPSKFEQTAATIPAEEIIPKMASILRSIWRIVNRRVRLEGLPPYHTAAMIVDVLTGGGDASVSVPRWLNHEVSYLAGVGFVPNSVYSEFVASEQYQRERALSTYTGSFTHQEVENVAWVSTASARAYAIELRQRRAHALPRTASATHSLHRRSVHFSRRSTFLKRHDLHGHDTFLHKVAPEHWVHLEGAAQAITIEQRRFYSLQAAALAGDIVGIVDGLLELVGLGPDVLSNIVELFEDLINSVWDVFSGDPANTVSDIEQLYSDFLTAIQCDVAQDLPIGGSGSYKLGCIPFLSERAADFIEPFPQDSAGKGILGYVEGPGYIEWPASMIAPGGDCPSPRVPSVQDPNAELAIWQRASSTLGVDGDPAVGNNNVDVFPLDFNNLLNNIAFTDWCTVSTAKRPLCPAFDWCCREYIPAADKGFTNGFVNIQVWLNDARVVVQRLFALDSDTAPRFAFIFIGFLLLGLADFFFLPIPFFTISGAGWAYLIVVAAMLFDVLLNQDILRFTVILGYLWLWLVAVPLVAWIQWAIICVQLGAFTLFGTINFLGDVGGLVLGFFPDTLVADLLLALANSSLLAFVLDTSVLADAATTVQSAQTMFGATEENNIYALFSIYNVFILALIGAPLLVVAGWALGLVFSILGELFSIVLSLFNLFFAIRATLVRRRLASLEDEVADFIDDTDLSEAQVEEEIRENSRVDEARYKQLVRQQNTLRRRVERKQDK